MAGLLSHKSSSVLRTWSTPGFNPHYVPKSEIISVSNISLILIRKKSSCVPYLWEIKIHIYDVVSMSRIDSDY